MCLKCWNDAHGDAERYTQIIAEHDHGALLAARDAELASLRLSYREAVKALNRLVEMAADLTIALDEASDGTGLRKLAKHNGVGAQAMAVLSTPEAQQALKEGQS